MSLAFCHMKPKLLHKRNFNDSGAVGVYPSQHAALDDQRSGCPPPGQSRCPVDLAKMVYTPLLALVLILLIVVVRPTALVYAAPLLATWLLAPGIAAWLSQPRTPRAVKLDRSQLRELRRLARRTWLFFEQFIGPEDQWLPPDHFQEAPLGIVAHRTSPTNIGLALLSALGAYDLGYLEVLTLSTRLTSSLDTLDKLERYQGHFLNWYDTRSLDPLQPRYVSTVDSGNLAACLLALRQGCLEVPEQPVLRWESFEGLLDAIDLLDAVFENLSVASLRPVIQELRSALSSIEKAIQSVKEEPARWVGCSTIWAAEGTIWFPRGAGPSSTGSSWDWWKTIPGSWGQRTCAACDITTGERASRSPACSAVLITCFPGSLL
jgi:hypothetical protein